MTIQWWRSWHGAPTDSKWLLIGRIAKVPPGMVSAVAWAIFDHASQHETRGSVEGFDPESYAAFAGFEDEQVRAIIQAMTTKGVIVDGVLKAWEKRQPKREDTSAERTKGYRERKRKVTQGDAVVTQCDAQASTVTQGDAPEKTRPEEEERRGESARPPIEAPPEPSVDVQTRGEDPLAKAQGGAPETTKKTRKPKKTFVPYEGAWDFEAFWTAYPRKTDKGEARRAMLSVERSGVVTFETVMAGIANIDASEPQYIKYPAPWLRAEAWANVPVPKAERLAPGAPVPFKIKTVEPKKKVVRLPTANFDERTWGPYIKAFKNDGIWDVELLGPNPRSIGCLVPREVREAWGFRRTITTNMNDGQPAKVWSTAPTNVEYP